MTKKTLFLSSIPIMALPAFAIVSCAGTTQSQEQQGQTELARFTFLQIKLIISQIANQKPNNATQFEQTINNMISSSNIPWIKSQDFKVQTEGNNFVVNYKLVIYSGTFDQAINNKDEIIAANKTEEFTGSFRFPILTNLQAQSDPSKPIASDLLETSEAKSDSLV